MGERVRSNAAGGLTFFCWPMVVLPLKCRSDSTYVHQVKPAMSFLQDFKPAPVPEEKPLNEITPLQIAYGIYLEKFMQRRSLE